MEQLCTVRNQVGESPLWSVAEPALYWVACIASHADGPVFVTRPGVCGIPETPFNPRVH